MMINKPQQITNKMKQSSEVLAAANAQLEATLDVGSATLVALSENREKMAAIAKKTMQVNAEADAARTVLQRMKRWWPWG